METSELLKKVRKIEIKTRGLSRHLFAGEYHSTFKGRGMSFSEVRNYQYGDDVRNIDWNVTARSGEPYVKMFEEERELTVMLLIDMSRSSFFGTTNQLKSDILVEICAVLAFSAINNNDKVGVIFFTDRIEKFIPPKKGKKHILLIIRELINIEPQGNRTDISIALRYLNNIAKKRSIAFLLSDFMTTGYEDPLRISAQRHDIVGIRLYDRHELFLPSIGLMQVRDSETGRVVWIDTNSEQDRQRYADYFEQHFQYFKNAFIKSRTDSLSIDTASSYINAMLKFFKQRH